MTRRPMSRAPGLRGRGFTLIELLVVVAIIGVVLAFVSLSLNPTGPSDRLDTDAKRLNALLGAAADDAVLYGREIGLDITRNGYRFLRLGDDGWQPIVGQDSPLHPRTLDGDIVLALVAQDEDRPTLTGETGEDDDKQDAVRPEVVLLSSGEIVPFELELAAEDVAYRYRLTGQANGDLKMKRVENRP